MICKDLESNAPPHMTYAGPTPPRSQLSASARRLLLNLIAYNVGPELKTTPEAARSAV
jgi:hypothetical protein